jgi:hypothetical protein
VSRFRLILLTAVATLAALLAAVSAAHATPSSSQPPPTCICLPDGPPTGQPKPNSNPQDPNPQDPNPRPPRAVATETTPPPDEKHPG